MAEVTTESIGSAAGSRGTAYPAFSLEEALLRARKFWDAERKNPAPVSAAVRHWGYGEKSSGGKRTVAALIQYGLLVDASAEGNRMVKLTDRALTILLSEPNSDIWLRAVREAAVSPKIYSDLLSKWPAHELPSDASLQFYLVKERNFNPSSVSDVIEDFRATVAYAKLDQVGEAIAYADSESDLPEFANALPPAIAAGLRGNHLRQNAIAAAAMGTSRALPPGVQLSAATPSVVRVSAPDVKQDIFSLDEGQVVLQWPAKMSAESYQDFKDWIELQVRKIGRAVQSASQEE